MIYWFAFIVLELRRNYLIIERDKKRPNYLGSFIFRAFCWLVCTVLTYKEKFDPAVIGVVAYIPYVVFCITSFWVLFSPILALSRKKKQWWKYRGKNSGWLSKLPGYIYWPLKGIALLIFLYLLFNPSKLFIWL